MQSTLFTAQPLSSSLTGKGIKHNAACSSKPWKCRFLKQGRKLSPAAVLPAIAAAEVVEFLAAEVLELNVVPESLAEFKEAEDSIAAAVDEYLSTSTVDTAVPEEAAIAEILELDPSPVTLPEEPVAEIPQPDPSPVTLTDETVVEYLQPDSVTVDVPEEFPTDEAQNALDQVLQPQVPAEASTTSIVDLTDSSFSESVPQVEVFPLESVPAPLESPALPPLPEPESLPLSPPSTPEDPALSDLFSSFNNSAQKYEEMVGRSRTPVQVPSSELSKDPLTALSSTISDALSSLNAAVENTNASVNSAIQNATDSFTSAVSNFVDSINGAIPRLPSPTFPLPSKDLNLSPSLPHFELPPGLSSSVESALGWASEASGQAAVLAGATLLQQYSFLKQQLPPDAVELLQNAEEQLQEFSGPASQFLRQASGQLLLSAKAVLRALEVAAGLNPDDSDTQILLGLSALSILLIVLSLSYWKALFSGYSGDLSAEDALRILRDSDAVLLDIRSESTRESEGIPDLRRGARFKEAHLEMIRPGSMVGSLPSREKGLVRNADDLDLQAMAVLVGGLKRVTRSTQVLVMDDNGSSRARDVARALQKYAGILRSYRVDGGFKGWSATQRVRELGPLSPVDIVKQEYEAIVEEVRPTTGGVAAVSAGVVLAGYALTEWEKALELLGLIAVVQALYSKVSSYETEEDLKKDIKLLLTPFALLAGLVAGSGVKSSTETQLTNEVVDEQVALSEGEEDRTVEVKLISSEAHLDGGDQQEREVPEVNHSNASTPKEEINATSVSSD